MMLTQIFRARERNGLIDRTVFAVVPPKVEYRLTGLEFTLGAAFCGVWIWASENLSRVEEARSAFDRRDQPSHFSHSRPPIAVRRPVNNYQASVYYHEQNQQ